MILYRYEDGWESKPYIREFPVYRETEKCYVIEEFGMDKFILKDPDGRRFAYATKQLAENSYRKRKQWQIIYAKASIRRAEAALDYLNGNEPTPEFFQLEPFSHD
jgi:hypothetical protein